MKEIKDKEETILKRNTIGIRIIIQAYESLLSIASEKYFPNVNDCVITFFFTKSSFNLQKLYILYIDHFLSINFINFIN